MVLKITCASSSLAEDNFDSEMNNLRAAIKHKSDTIQKLIIIHNIPSKKF